MWVKAGMEFITNNGQRVSREAICMAILVMDGVGEGKLGMVTTFCHNHQTKMEASEAISALCQCDSPEPSVVVVQGYTNLAYLPQGSIQFPLSRCEYSL